MNRLPTSTIRRFEDGTPNFLGILSIQYGFEALREVGGLKAINRHTMIVTEYLYWIEWIDKGIDIRN